MADESGSRKVAAQARQVLPPCVEGAYQTQAEHDVWGKRSPATWPCPACAALKNAKELNDWRTWGVVEIASRNASVAEYCLHLETRVEKAEIALAETRNELATIRSERGDSEYICRCGIRVVPHRCKTTGGTNG